VSTYTQYRQLRILCGFDDDHGALAESVWDGCEPDAQENMLGQLRAVAAQRAQALAKFGGDHW